MKNEILISTIIPMYNAEKFISKCLEHLIHQTYKNLEIIIVDDGSTDNSVLKCENYAKKDSRIKIIKQNNAGPAAASNTGLKIAKGEYVHFHDHDDFVNLDYFEKMAAAANLTGADILCGEVNQPEYNFPTFNAIEICTSMKDKILKTKANKFNPAWRYVYKKSFLNENNLIFNSKLFGAQDLFFTKTAVVLAETIATVPAAVYNVVNTETALGKSKELIKQRNNQKDIYNAENSLRDIFVKYNALEFMEMEDQPILIETLKIFNFPIIKKSIFKNKIRYYLFGINIGTKHIIKNE